MGKIQKTAVAVHLLLTSALLYMGMAASIPTMESTGMVCPTSNARKSHDLLNPSTCQPKEMLFKFELNGCETADYKCLNICAGVCSNSSNIVQGKPPYKRVTCPQCVPRRTYNIGTLKLKFKCNGETVEKTLDYRKIKRCACRWDT